MHKTMINTTRVSYSFILYLFCSYPPIILQLFSIYPPIILHLFCIYSPFVLQLFSIYSSVIIHLFFIYSPFILHLFFIYSQLIFHLFTQYSTHLYTCCSWQEGRTVVSSQHSVQSAASDSCFPLYSFFIYFLFVQGPRQ